MSNLELETATAIIAKHHLYAPLDDFGISSNCYCGYDLTDKGRWDNDPERINAAHDAHIAGLVLEAVTVPAPTGDQRERLAELIGYVYNRSHYDPAGKTADAVIAAGFRLPAPVEQTRLAKLTPRGFTLFADFPYMNALEEMRFTVQESSAASERQVWISAGNDRTRLTEDEARTVRDALTAFLGEAAKAAPVEVEWEYGVMDKAGHFWGTATATSDERDGDVRVRRTKVGPWLPVEPEGEES